MCLYLKTFASLWISDSLLSAVFFAVILHHLWSAASVRGLRTAAEPRCFMGMLRVRPAVNFHAVELWLAETLSLTPSLMVQRAHQPR